jgi:hypothetical protein
LGKVTIGEPLPAIPFPFVLAFPAGEALRRGLALGPAISTKRFDSTPVFPLGAAVLRNFSAGRTVSATLDLRGFVLRLFAFVFFEAFFGAFAGALFAPTVSLAVFLAFFAPLLLFFARLFDADALAPPFDLPPSFLAAFFLAFATTISFYYSN